MELMEGGVGNAPIDINKSTNTKTGFLGKRVPLTAKDVNGKSINMAVNSVEWVNGKEYYVGYQLPKTMGYSELAQAQLSGMPEVRVPVNSYNKTQLITNIGSSVSKGDRPTIRKNLSQYENTPMSVMKFNEATPTQKLRAEKEGRKIISMSQIRRENPQTEGLSDNDLYKSIEASAKGSKVLIIK